MSRKIEIQVIGDVKQLEAALGRAQTKTSKFGTALAAGTKVAAGALLGLGLAAKFGAAELIDHQKVAKQTNAVIKSTGGAAHVSAEQVNELAQSLLAKSGVDDEVIQSGENVLLTFRNIRNEAGKGNDIFTQTTKAALDLSVAMKEDLKSASLQVGKALNDPIHGLTALKRVGVQFTDAQTALIKKLVETGHTAAAQKVILGELNKEFGGSAAAAGKTLPGQLSILREKFADVAASLVTALLPAVLQLVGVLNTAATWMKNNGTATKILVSAIAALSVGVIAVNAVYKVWSATTKVVAAAQWLLNAALDANPVVLVVAGIIALGVALVIAYKKSETFRNIVAGAIDWVKKHWELLVAAIPGLGLAIILVVKHFKTIRDVAGSVFDFVVGKVQSVINAVKSLWGWIKTAFGALQSLADKLSSIPNPFGGGTSNNYRSPANATGGSNNPHPGVVIPSGSRSGGSSVVYIQLDGKTIATALVPHTQDYKRQNGRPMFA